MFAAVKQLTASMELWYSWGTGNQSLERFVTFSVRYCVHKSTSLDPYPQPEKSRPHS